MLLTGDDARDPAGYTITQLETILQAKLALSPWAEDFAEYGGAACLDDQVEAASCYGTKQPFFFFELGDMREHPESNCSGYIHWILEISIEVVTNASSAPIENRLKAALVSIVSKAFDDLIALGIEGSSIRAGQGRDMRSDRACPHTFFCEVFAEL